MKITINPTYLWGVTTGLAIGFIPFFLICRQYNLWS